MSHSRKLGLGLSVALMSAAMHAGATAGEPGGNENAAKDVESTVLSPYFDEGEAGNVIQWKYDKGLKASTADGKFSMKTNVRVQVRATAVDNDSKSTKQDTLDFEANRVRLKIGGNAFGENTKYKFQADFASKKGSGGELKDAQITHKLHGHDELQVSGGQFKVPFSRNELTSSGSQQFVDRPLTNKEFVPGREPGLMLHGTCGDDGMFEWAAMVSNGEGANAVNGDNHPRFTGRVVVNPLGDPGYSESDLKRQEEIQPSVGVNVTHTKSKPTGPDADEITVGVEAMVKGKGAYVTGEWYHRTRNLEGGVNDATDNGFFVQGGVLPIPDLPVEFGLRFGQNHFGRVAPGANSNGANVENVQEVSGVIGYFPFGHNLKIQADVTGRFTDVFSGTGAKDLEDVIARIQAQIIV